MKNRICFTDIVLAVIGAGTILFIVEVLEIFREIGQEPSTLVAGFFSFATAEAAICWRIHTGKKKHKEEIDPADLDIEADPNGEGEG